MKPKVYFLYVKDTASKLQQLCKIIGRHFGMRDRLLIHTPSKEAADYVDQLLWRMPEDSFLPHCIADIPVKERIAITIKPSNINGANVIVNLSPTPYLHPNLGKIDLIYELLDLTAPEKEALSRNKQTAYRAADHFVDEVF